MEARETRLERALRSPACLTALVLLGLLLRTWAFVASPPLWLDELLLGRNILGLSAIELATRPLLLDQVAPRGFLLVEKVATVAFGRSELALRAFPFLSGIAALFLFRRLAVRALQGLAVPFAVAAFALGVPCIHYCAEVKQYSTDAAAAIALVLLALKLSDSNDAHPGRPLAAGLAGLAIACFSQPSVLVMGGAGFALVTISLALRDPELKRALLITLPLWGLGSLIAVLVGFHSMTPSTKAFMSDFWKRGFLPLPLRGPQALQWLGNRLFVVFEDPTLLRYPVPLLFISLVLLGIVALWRARRAAALIVLGPIVLALAAAIAWQYPFVGRVMFYLVPGFLLLVGAGAGLVAGQARRLHPAAAPLLTIALLAAPLAALIKSPPPYDIEHSGQLLRYLIDHRQPGDAIHVFPLQRIGLLYYGPRLGLKPEEWNTARCDSDDARTWVRDLERYRGARRLWVLSSRVTPFFPARTAVMSYLDAIGIKRDTRSWPSLNLITIDLDLYDLSDPARLLAASAETFPVPPMSKLWRPGCRPWTAPSPLDSYP